MLLPHDMLERLLNIKEVSIPMIKERRLGINPEQIIPHKLLQKQLTIPLPLLTHPTPPLNPPPLNPNNIIPIQNDTFGTLEHNLVEVFQKGSFLPQLGVGATGGATVGGFYDPVEDFVQVLEALEQLRTANVEFDDYAAQLGGFLSGGLQLVLTLLQQADVLLRCRRLD